jgi:uncharacterized membrane protein YqjE
MSATDPGAPDRSREPLEADKSVGELFSELTGDLGTLLRKEVELAKVETKEEVRRAGKAGAMFAGAGIAAYTALLFLSFTLAWLLDEVMHVALAFLVVAVIHGLAAAALAMQGRNKIKQVQPVPETVATLKEDVEWAKAQRN